MNTLMFLSGSQRRESFNTRLLDHLAGLLDEDFAIDWLEPSQARLPIFDQDSESEAEPLAQALSLQRRMLACQGLVVASPEYNTLPSPYLKNIVDWISRLPHIRRGSENPFQDLPVLLCSASTGWSGGALGLHPARNMFAYLGCQVQGDTICIPHAAEVWTDLGYAFNAAYENQIAETVKRFLQCVRAAMALRTPQLGTP